MTDSTDPDNHGDLAELYRLQVREHDEFAMFLIGADGRLRTWNKGVERLFGYEEEEWVGQDTNLIFTEEDRAAGVARTEMQHAAEEGRASDIRWHVRKDGTPLFMLGVLKALRNEQGCVMGYSKVTMDYTARKRLDDAITRSNTDLQQFAYVASHDMQEPLRTVSGFAQLLQQRYRGRLDEEADEMLHFVADAAQRMSDLVRDLLAYARLANEDSRAESVEMDADLETALSLLQTSIKETGAVITHDPLPSVAFDRGQMVRLFQNLVGNAIKFRKPTEAPRVHVSAERQGDEWIIRVRDNGIGFPPTQAANIFMPFKRLHGAEEYPGSGIGLAACERIVGRHGGRIGAESEEGHGATFWFTVPVS